MNHSLRLHRWSLGRNTSRASRAARRKYKPLLEPLENYYLLSSVYTVISTDDGSPTDSGTLRWAITQADTDTGSTINFDISGSGPWVIDLASALPTITVPTTIDGTSQTGYSPNDTPVIEINGASVIGAAGLTLGGLSSGTTVEGLSIVDFATTNVAPGYAGILIDASSTNDTIEKNYIGVTPTDTPAPNGTGIIDQAAGATIGGTLGAGNLIANNTFDGIYIDHADGALIEGNTIDDNGSNGIFGTSLTDGTVTIANNTIGSNTVNGIYSTGGSVNLKIQGNLIESNVSDGIHGVTLTGGALTIASNTISGNVDGIYVNDYSIDPSINNNLIDTNTNDGISLNTSTTVTGLTASILNNTISGTVASVGVSMYGGAVSPLIQGNVINTNGSDGIYIFDESSATIGGTTIGAGNVIGGNSGDGIDITAKLGVDSTNDLIEDNQIGIFANGCADANSLTGVAESYVSGMGIFGNTISYNLAGGISDSNSVGTTIGGTVSGQANVIELNHDQGVLLDNSNGVVVDGNTILTNSQSGIKASDTSVTGAVFENNTIKWNTGNGIYASGGTVNLVVEGNYVADNSGNGIDVSSESNVTIGGTTLAAANVIVSNGGDGISLQGVVATPSTGDFIEGNFVGVLANLTTAAGNSVSGISDEYVSGLTVIGNTVEHNVQNGIDSSYSTGVTIGGAAIGAGNVFSLNSTGIEIDSSTLGLIEGNTIDTNTKSGIRGAADGNSIAASGSTITNNTISGNSDGSGIYISNSLSDLTISDNTFNSNYSEGIELLPGSPEETYTISLVGNTIMGCTDGDGIQSSGGTALLSIQQNVIENNVGDGISISNESNVTIGGTLSGAGNTIAGNSQNGIELLGTNCTPSTGDLVQGNTIGINTAGTASPNLGDGIYDKYLSGFGVFGNTIENNGEAGIYDDQSVGTTIGGTATGAANTISNNSAYGIQLYYSSGVVIDDNTIDSNASSGIYGEHLIGTGAWIGDNTIVLNKGDGIYVDGFASCLTIYDNDIASNTTGGVDISPSTVCNPFTASIDDNCITANGGDGIYAAGGSLTGLLIQDNNIEGNSGDGIDTCLVSNITIGGTASCEGNEIAGNCGDGIDVHGTYCTPANNILIEGNTIGLTEAGCPLPNACDGIYADDVTNITIGGTAGCTGNDIGANCGDGIDVEGTSVAPSSNILIEGNVIGLDQYGCPTPNGGDGIYADHVTNITIGGTAGCTGNDIGANCGDGIDIEGTGVAPSSNILIEGNVIGLNQYYAPAPNGGDGIYADYVTNITIGGWPCDGEDPNGNLIVLNYGDGIELGHAADVEILGNTVATNCGTGVKIRDLECSGALIADNRIGYNGGAGIYVQYSSVDITIQDNDINDNGLSGIAITAGCSSSSTFNAKITSNSITGNGESCEGGAGIWVTGGVVTVTVLGNYDVDNNGDGIEIWDESNIIIGGSTTADRNVIDCNDGDGISIEGTCFDTSSCDLIENNDIGTFLNNDVGGNTGNNICASYTTDLAIFGNKIEGSVLGAGIDIFRSTRPTIGGTAKWQGNIIEGNDFGGIVMRNVDGPSVIGNTIDDNSYNCVESGSYGGISAQSLSSSPAVFLDNTIDDNYGAGIYIANSYVNLTIVGNDIEGNASSGIGISTLDHTSTAISVSIANNLIKSNGGDGIYVSGGIVTLAIQTNTIESNCEDGIAILGESNATIGGTSAALGNIIAGNGGDGIYIDGLSNNYCVDVALTPDEPPMPFSYDDLIQNNFIGVVSAGCTFGPGVTGRTANLGDGIDVYYTFGLEVVGNTIAENCERGVSIELSIDPLVGGSAIGTGNVIADNGLAGISMYVVDGPAVVGNLIEYNGCDGVYASSVVESSANFVGNTISGNYGAGIFVLDSQVELFIAGNDISYNYGPGVGISENWGPCTNPFPAIIVDNAIVNNAWDGIYVANGAVTVTAGDNEILDNGGNGIELDFESNAVIVDNWIADNVGNGIYIEGTSCDPSKNDLIADNTIGGYSYSSGNSGAGIWALYTANLAIKGNLIAENSYSGIDLSYGNSTGASIIDNTILNNGEDGIYVAVGYVGVTIADNDIQGNSDSGIGLSLAGQAGVAVEASIKYNTIDNNGGNGIFATSGLVDMSIIGNTVGGNCDDGIHVWDEPSVTIGGDCAGMGNVIENNGCDGVFVGVGTGGVTMDDNTIENNRYAGVSLENGAGSSKAVGASLNYNTIDSNQADGIYAFSGIINLSIIGNTVDSNSGDGIDTFNEPNATIGGACDGMGNTIEWNGGDGIYLGASTVMAGATAQNNTIAYNCGAGIDLNSSNNTIGGEGSYEGNTIMCNGQAGVALGQNGPATGNMISGNSIYGNGALGIDLDYGGEYSGIPLPNGSGIANNDGQDYPVLTSVAVTDSGTTAYGTIGGNAGDTYTIEIFSTPTADASGYGQGQTYLGSTEVSGDSSFFVFLGSSAPIGTIISATATDMTTNNTSEFSLNATALPTTTTSLTIDAVDNTSVYGQVITFTATVANVSPGVDLPTGTVDFEDDGTVLGTGTLNGMGVATFQTTALTSLTVGLHSDLTAVYVGDVNNNGSTSVPVADDVTEASTLTVVSSSANPSVYGQSVTFTATVTAVAPGGGTPTGTVSFSGLGISPVAGTEISPGVWTVSTSALPVGSTPDITASYSGDGNFLSGTSSAIIQVVDQASTSTTVTSSINPSVFGQTVTFTATVAAASPGAGTPTGTVSFSGLGGSPIAGTEISPGVWTVSTSALPVGSNTDITASYSGDGNFVGGTSVAITQEVDQASALTAVTVAVTPVSDFSVFGQLVTFTATVTAVAPGAGTPTGTVSFSGLGISPVAGTEISPGVWTVSTSALPVGSNSDITASYSGDGNFVGGTSAPVTQVVDQASTSTTLTSSISPSVFGQTVTFTATVTAVAPGAGTPSGTVSFSGLGISPVAGTEISPGVWTVSTSALPVGSTPDITASYSGDGNFVGGTSAAITQEVDQASTLSAVTVAVTPASDFSVFGQLVTFTATVTAVAPGGGTPTGTVSFSGLGNSPISATEISPGVWAVSTSALPVGSTPDITASYSGDGNFVGGTSAAITQVVDQASTSTTVTSSINPSVLGQSVTFTATVTAVAPGGGTPTGTVSFSGLGNSPISATEISPGVWTVSTSALPVGSTPDITASYSGDGNFQSSDSSAFAQTVNAASTSTTVTSSSNTSVFGQTVTLTATVTATEPGAGTPTGTVTFYDGGGPIGSGTLASPGVWTLSTDSLPVGSSQSIYAIYNGSANFHFSESLSITQSVNQAATLSTLSALPNPSSVGQTVTFTASVTAVAPGVGVPTGTVTFLDGATVLGTGTLSGGTATFTDSALATGSHSISFTYAGDANFLGSSAAAVSQSVQVPTNSIVVPSVTTTTTGQPITLSVTIVGGNVAPNIVPSISFAASPAASTPTGTVTFYDGNTVLGTAPVNQYGVATLVIPSLPAGQSTITAAYSGDAVYAPSVSNIANITVISADVDGPTVATVQRYGYHHQATSIVISFNDALDAGSAQTLSNYSLVGPANKHGKGGHPIHIGAAVYNAASNTVTLSLKQSWNLHQRWTLTINGTGPNGVKNSAGVLLDGAGNGGAGTNHVTTLTGKDLAGNAASLPKVVHAKVKELLHHVHSVVRKGR